jgi:hypothetical protein
MSGNGNRNRGKTNFRQPEAAADAATHHKVEELTTQLLMENWARWKSGVSISVAVSRWGLEARGRRDVSSIPLLNGEAADVDSAVDALPPELRQAVVEYWLKKGTAEKHARACRCELRTFYRRLDHAHERIRALLRAKRDQAERARRDYLALRGGALVKRPSP